MGLGGRLDATNLITPIATAITSIGLDHVKVLGNTLEKIAWEKAGIMKKNIPVFITKDVPLEPVITKAIETNSEIIHIKK